jgi:2-polyprenyl-6-methoxyphenol hydroxylase-like FAD-dependent oxidoreductase
LRFNTEIKNIAELEIDKHDLVVAGDGITSILRDAYKDKFQTTMDWRANKFCWLVVGSRLSLRGGHDHLDRRDQ